MILERQLLENELLLKKEREKLDKLAEESLRAGRSLSDSPEVLKQARIVDGYVLREVELQKMLEERGDADILE